MRLRRLFQLCCPHQPAGWHGRPPPGLHGRARVSCLIGGVAVTLTAEKLQAVKAQVAVGEYLAYRLARVWARIMLRKRAACS